MMKIYVALPGTSHMPGTPAWACQLRAPDYQRIARAIDELGYDAITSSEHFAMPYEEVPRLGPYWMQGLSVMAFLAGATSRVRVDATVLVLPYHHPLSLAKAVTTMDALSGGRVNLSVGVGHAVAEFEALGVSFADRGAIADEMLAAMVELWTAEKPVHHGKFFDIEGVAFEPKPVQSPRPPIFIGGNSKPALRRAARHDGWQPNPTDFSLEDLPPLLEYLYAQPEYAGKEDTFDICWLGSPPMWEAEGFGTASPSVLEAYRDRVVDWCAELGGNDVTRTSLPLPPTGSVEEYIDHLQWFDQEVAPRLGA
jgi:probable F420-dependent oxidoreductase